MCDIINFHGPITDSYPEGTADLGNYRSIF